MVRRKKVYEGKTKILFDGPEPGTLVQYFKDDTKEGKVSAGYDGKGVLNNRLSEFFMSGLSIVGIPTHFIRRLNMREQMVRMAEVLPFKIVVRNFSDDGFEKRLGIPAGMALPRPLVEYYYKDENLKMPMVTEEHIVAFGWATHQDIEDILTLALRVNDFISGMMIAVGVRLADFDLELGRVWDGEYTRFIVVDEISPDNCRLWDLRGVTDRVDGQAVASPEPLVNASAELARRFGVMPSHVTHVTKSTMMN